METNPWWLWVILSALFVLGEIFTAGFFLLWFGIGAALAAITALLGFGLAPQMVVFIVFSSVMFAVSRRFADRVSDDQPPGIGADRFVGEECLVTEEIDSLRGTGRVRMGKEDWRARSSRGQSIAVDQRVKVIGVSGTQLVVESVEEGG